MIEALCQGKRIRPAFAILINVFAMPLLPV